MLYEHNKIVYQKLIETLSVDNCACIVMGTGVGKSYVALEYITQHNCTALIVSPRTSINDSWKKLCGDKCDVITYQKLANIYKEIDYSFYDVIICDEVHHIGAPKWGESIKFLIESKKVVIGLTESSIRYTDGGKDVAYDFFHGNIVFGESVSSAIEKKILNPVTYVGAMYNSDGLKKTIRGKIQSRLYAKLNLAINKTPTVEEILKKNMPSGKRKGIIFASTINDINYAIDFMRSVYPNADIRFVHSKQPASYNNEVFKWFNETDEGYICSVDMISEGVHIKGVNTLIMLRRTESLNLFNQQLGRCLDANSKESAIVFDLVNNKYSIRIINGKARIKTNSIFSSSKLNVVPSEQLIIKDYTKDIVEVLEEISQSLQINYWSKEELDILSKYYLDEGQSIYVRLPKRTLPQIRHMAWKLGLIRNQRWSDKDVSVMQKKYGKVSNKEISLLINKTPGAIQRKANELGLTDNKKAGVSWSDEEVETLKQLYPTASWEIMISTFNRTKLSIKHKAQNIGLCRDLEISQKYLRKKRD